MRQYTVTATYPDITVATSAYMVLADLDGVTKLSVDGATICEEQPRGFGPTQDPTDDWSAPYALALLRRRSGE